MRGRGIDKERETGDEKDREKERRREGFSQITEDEVVRLGSERGYFVSSAAGVVSQARRRRRRRRLYSRRSTATSLSREFPGHVLAATKAPPIAQPSGRAHGHPELAPSDWPARQAQPLPWLFPNFRACGAPSSPPPLHPSPPRPATPVRPSRLPSPRRTSVSPSLRGVITVAVTIQQPSRELSPSPPNPPFPPGQFRPPPPLAGGAPA